MPIITYERLPGGAAAAFADCPEFIPSPDGRWPARNLYEADIFFRFSDSLVDILCSATRTYLPFPQHDLTQLHDHHDLMKLASEFLLRAHILAITPAGYLQRDAKTFLDYGGSFDGTQPKGWRLQQDLIDTLLFLAGKCADIATMKRCLLIAGH